MTNENVPKNDDIMAHPIRSLINAHDAINKDLELLDKIKTDASYKAVALAIIADVFRCCFQRQQLREVSFTLIIDIGGRKLDKSDFDVKVAPLCREALTEHADMLEIKIDFTDVNFIASAKKTRFRVNWELISQAPTSLEALCQKEIANSNLLDTYKIAFTLPNEFFELSDIQYEIGLIHAITYAAIKKSLQMEVEEVDGELIRDNYTQKFNYIYIADFLFASSAFPISKREATLETIIAAANEIVKERNLVLSINPTKKNDKHLVFKYLEQNVYVRIRM